VKSVFYEESAPENNETEERVAHAALNGSLRIREDRGPHVRLNGAYRHVTRTENKQYNL
jgi:hypothetical protein